MPPGFVICLPVRIPHDHEINLASAMGRGGSVQPTAEGLLLKALCGNP